VQSAEAATPKSILIVDDEEDICDFLVYEFAARGWHTAFALDGESAWQHLRQEPVDVVVSDVKMPISDGLALLKRARGMNEPPVFLLITGYSALDERASAGDEQADAILAKPFSLDQLIQLVDRCLAERAATGAAGGAM
jgi:two-component system response regulator YesN